MEVEHSKTSSLAQLDAAAGAPPAGRPSLLAANVEELEEICAQMGQPTYRGRQIAQSIFARRVRRFEDLTDLPMSLRTQLASRFDLSCPQIDDVQVSDDGTRKYRFLGSDGVAFESVYIPEVAKTKKTNTLCLSSQSGCALGCRFCLTATLRRNRNLAASEIIGQLLAVQDDVAELGEYARVTNVVFMGMGEPLLNYEQLLHAIAVLTGPLCCDFSSRRVTVSTAGIVPRIHDLGRDAGTQLAVSLNATTDEVRDRIMPVNKKWPIAELLAALRAYPLPRRRRITIEYVLLDGINDSKADARRLVKLLEGIPVKVNLLPLNRHDHTQLQPPPEERVERFVAELKQRDINAIRRKARGGDISAACGQLGLAAVPAT